MVDINILFVDDERNILGSLQRVFRKEGYGILLAESGESGLDLLNHNNVAVVVSDQRMPGMGGVEFLRRVRESAPDTIRMMLTGQADMSDIAGAINKGEVYRYITKPWNDDEIRLTVKAAVERFSLVSENRRLQAETMRQNAELYDLNQTLEAKVEEKTKKLREGFFAFAGLCVDLIELHDQHSGGRCKRVAALAKTFAQRLGLKGAELEAVWAAALLHEIGLVGVPKETIEKYERELTDGERALIRNNPRLSHEILSKIDTLRQAGLIIRSHMENFDGTGYPDRLKGEEINVGSRILAICRDYDRLMHAKGPCSRIEALAAIDRGRSKRFDPQITDAFLDLAGEDKKGGEPGDDSHDDAEPTTSTMMIEIQKIVSGMVLAKPLMTGRGRLLVAEGTVLSEALIEKVLNFHKLEPITDAVSVLSH